MITNSENGLIVWFKQSLNSIFYFYFFISFIKFILIIHEINWSPCSFRSLENINMYTIFCTNFSLKKIKTHLDCYRKIIDCTCWYYKKIMNLNEQILIFVFAVLKKYTCIRFTKDYDVYQYIKNKKYED